MLGSLARNGDNVLTTMT